MSAPEFPLGPSRVVAGRYPPPGTDSYADAIRERRGARGITPLDANLLHVPPVAGGYNTLMGAIRVKGKLPGDIREAMILRVAAINHAAFEWIHHEHIGRTEGLSTGQLYIIRDEMTPLPPLKTILTPLQSAALAFTDHSTRNARVPMDVIQEYKHQLKTWAIAANPSMNADDIDAKVDDLYVEATMVVASYNMVSRFLLATDVGGISDMEVPWPVDKKEHFVSLPSFPPAVNPTHEIHAITLVTSIDAPWLVFSNSLLTDWTMWSYVVPYFLDLPSSTTSATRTSPAADATSVQTTYNILLHSQRGHGLSTLPIAASNQARLVTIPLLAVDIWNLLVALSIPIPVQAVIGVSQGGAAALAFGALHGGRKGVPAKTKTIIACDTAPRTPAGNKEAWEERIKLVLGPFSEGPDEDVERYAQCIGMRKLAKATVPRWFPPGSSCNTKVNGEENKRASWVEKMVERTNVAGFIQGARALGDYDVLNLQSSLSSDMVASEDEGGLFATSVERVLLVAGSLDGGGKFLRIEGGGHLPMIDSPETFTDLIGQYLGGL
ncbi:Alpha/Beta hydrolase protein [Crassisporium funariophilum]|nr:Alpha/Beta hydrolase protein [Crassisporium funariophilum]